MPSSFSLNLDMINFSICYASISLSKSHILTIRPSSCPCIYSLLTLCESYGYLIVYLYLYSNNKRLYYFYSLAVFIINFQGSKGPTGSAGPAGSTGPPGTQGMTGLPGASGSKGDKVCIFVFG